MDLDKGQWAQQENPAAQAKLLKPGLRASPLPGQRIEHLPEYRRG
jgi:hypothetical protein